MLLFRNRRSELCPDCRQGAGQEAQAHASGPAKHVDAHLSMPFTVEEAADFQDLVRGIEAEEVRFGLAPPALPEPGTRYLHGRTLHSLDAAEPPLVEHPRHAAVDGKPPLWTQRPAPAEVVVLPSNRERSAVEEPAGTDDAGQPKRPVVRIVKIF